MTTKREIKLHWDGPHSPFEDNGNKWRPPEESGVYVFTIEVQGKSIITYVGEASDLCNRLNEHIFYFLGGGYALVEEDRLSETGFPDGCYDYEPEVKRRNLVPDFLNDYERKSKLAIANLKRYRFTWAVLKEGRAMRQAVESALICKAGKREDKENARVSLADYNVEPLEIHSDTVVGGKLPIDDLGQPLEFGTKGQDPDTATAS